MAACSVSQAVRRESAGTGANWAGIVEKIQSGDKTAVERLYKMLADGPCLAAFRRLDPQFAEDQLHEVMVIVIEAIQQGELRDPDRLMGFIWAVARRQMVAYIRVASMRRRKNADLTRHEQGAPRADSPEERTSCRERQDAVKKMLSRLKARDREILERFYYGEQAPEQICREMNLTATQFRVYKSRAVGQCGDIARRSRVRFQSTSPFWIA